ncbi:hypothetical protein DJ64_12300 [Streptomyces griseorubens]|uniref:FTP domain-containing protein n=1 Tax=Streptomyces griseorubens TaxID=66897 RepID=A0ABR4SXM3_9ACTN|nr:hypothetical protein DJ64_12300 [Streptomyces griseorubens]
MTPLYARRRRTALAAATAVAAGALLTTGLATGTATADSAPAGKPVLGSAPVLLSAAARTSLIQEQQSTASGTADAIGLGAKEKLIVKDVVKDVDGTVHTRYERTYDGRTDPVVVRTLSRRRPGWFRPPGTAPLFADPIRTEGCAFAEVTRFYTPATHGPTATFGQHHSTLMTCTRRGCHSSLARCTTRTAPQPSGTPTHPPRSFE